MKRKQNDGKWFENKVRDVLENYKRFGAYYYMRLYDTTSASKGKSVSYLPKQPGDFILLYPGCVCLIEAKSSEKHNSLRSCLSDNVDPAQAAAHRLWQRAGHPSVFLFCDIPNKTVECWDGLIVATARCAKGKSLPKGGAEFTCSLEDMQNQLADYLTRIQA